MELFSTNTQKTLLRRLQGQSPKAVEYINSLHDGERSALIQTVIIGINLAYFGSDENSVSDVGSACELHSKKQLLSIMRHISTGIRMDARTLGGRTDESLINRILVRFSRSVRRCRP